MTTSAPSLAHRLRDAVLARVDTQVFYATPKAPMKATPAETLDQLERDIDAPLPPLVRAFYLGAGELGLAWQEGAPAAPVGDAHVAWNQLSDLTSEFWAGARTVAHRGGIISIPPAREVFQKGHWVGRLVPEPCGEEVELDGRTLPDSTLYGELYPFDLINGYHLAGLWFDRASGDWRVILGDDHGACWTDHRTLSVADYFGQLERELGGLRHWPVGEGDESREVWALEPGRGRGDFPGSSEERGESDMDARLIRRLAESSPVLEGPALEQALEAHRQFLGQGDTELEWELLAAGNLPLCVYGGTTDDDADALEALDDAGTRASALPAGPSAAAGLQEVVQDIERAFAPLRRDPRQLVLRLKRLHPGASLAGTDLSCADLSCAVAEGGNFHDAVLDRSIAVNAFFDGADFGGASLANVDFTRSSLRGCSFRGAVLRDTDFQDTDLTGADFTGADVENARFPGALLDDVRR